jgi:hypothetical protein
MMIDRAFSPGRAVVGGGGPSPAAGKPSSSPARELAQRQSGTIEILLLWHPETEGVELSVRDVVTDMGFEIEVEPGNAIDAFNHPYAYAPKRDTFRRVLRVERTIAGG